MNVLLTVVWVLLVFDAGVIVGSWWASRRWFDDVDAADVLNEHRLYRDGLLEDDPS